MFKVRSLLDSWRKRFSREPWLGVPSDILHLKESTRSYRQSLGRNIYPFSGIKLLRAEVAGILGRIRAIRETQLYARMVRIDPAHSTGVSPDERERIADACIQDKDNLAKSRPHLTLVDVELYVQGWTHGHEWTHRNYCK